MIFEKNDKLVMIGESITDCERQKPIGEGLFGALGNGYVSLFNALLQSKYPDNGIRVVNMGISGNTTRNLKERWQTDVMDLKPDWVSIMIGVNDVWRQFDVPQIKESHVYLDEYRATLTELVEKTLPEVKGLILITPFFIEKNRDDAMRSRLDEYNEVVKEVAAEYNLLHVDVQSAIDQLLEYKYSAELAWDRVHPSLTGHMTIANEILKIVEN